MLPDVLKQNNQILVINNIAFAAILKIQLNTRKKNQMIKSKNNNK